MRLGLVCSALTIALASTARANAVITNVAELLALSNFEIAQSKAFAISGVLIGQKGEEYILYDGKHCIPILISSYYKPELGDIVKIDCGATQLHDFGLRTFESRGILKIGHTSLHLPKAVSIADLHDGDCDFANVCVHGIIREVFQDEVDPHFTYVVISSDDSADGPTLLCSLFNYRPSLKEGSSIELVGIYYPWISSVRCFMGPMLFVSSEQSVRILSAPTEDINDYPEVPDMIAPSPSGICALGRRRIDGVVIAAWGGNKLLIRSDDGLMHRIELANGQALPACDDVVRVGGRAETDLYLINLSHATFKAIGHKGETSNSPLALTPETILRDERGRRVVNPEFYGKTIRICGTVTKPQSVLHDNEHVYLDCGQHIVPVDVSAIGAKHADIPIGSKVEASGICLLNIENWVSGAPTPRINGFSVVARAPADIVVLARPPWWTPGKFLIVICTLITGIIGFLFWIRILNRLVERRSRELLRAQISRTTAELKVAERTRLAVELHDSLSQNLSGIACQLVAMKCAITAAPETIGQKLLAAEQMLQSCRTELRRCLFDLRGKALEIGDMNEAVRETLLPVAGSADLRIRFNVPRSKLVDTTAHAILCIIRELVSNAIRHGKATQIGVAGNMEREQLAFSVKDNGCGFDPERCPGPKEGHFGLQGIRDRANRLGGTFTISSRPGGGVRAKVEVHIPAESNPTAIQ